MKTVLIWSAAALAYALFYAWYTNRRGPLSAREIADGMRRMEEFDVGSEAERAVLREFFEHDDGREFLMLNLVKLAEGPVVDPVTGEQVPPRRVLERYSRPFLRALARRAGHPAFFAQPVGGFVDTWGLDPGPRWSMVGMVRYRSRRDALELIATSEFADIHGFKHLAMPRTANFPMGRMRLYAGPRLLVGLLLALVAALAT